MSALTAIAWKHEGAFNDEELLECINPLRLFTCERHQAGNIFQAVGFPNGASGASCRLHNDGRFVCQLAGDIIIRGDFPWEKVTRAVDGDEGGLAFLRSLQGTFVLVVYDSAKSQLHVVTDSFGFQPVYIQQSDSGLVVSTAIATFLRGPGAAPPVDDKWVYEHIFFNYAVGDRTFLENVRRQPAGTILTFDVRSAQQSTVRYLEPISRKQRNGDAASEIDEAISLFSSIVPEWTNADGPVAFGLSGGLDSRAVLAALPRSDYEHVHTFTYGIPGSTEIVEAAEITGCLGIQHQELFLDDSFLPSLPQLMYDTVYLSDGQQIINRSQLPVVYGSLGVDGNPVSALLTGVSGDHLFRDHISAWGNVPYLISPDMASQHREGRNSLNRESISKLFAGNIEGVESHLESALDDVEQRYGSYGDEEAYFRFLMYVAGPRYFGGQAAIANCYTAFRTPYWDRRLVQFAMDINLGTVGLSKLSTGKDKFEETILQASVVANHKKLATVPYLNLPIGVFTKKTQTSYQVHRVIRRLKATLFNRKRITEENWPLWYRTVLADEIQELLGQDSLIRNYVSEELITGKLAENNIHFLGKLITVEIILRLVANRWKRDLNDRGPDPLSALGTSSGT